MVSGYCSWDYYLHFATLYKRPRIDNGKFEYNSQNGQQFTSQAKPIICGKARN